MLKLLASKGLQRGDQLGQGNTVVLDETPGSLALGLAGSFIRQGLGGGGEWLGTACMLLNQGRVATLQAFVQVGEWNFILLFYAPTWMCRYHWLHSRGTSRPDTLGGFLFELP